jgi:hypothetical protein
VGVFDAVEAGLAGGDRQRREILEPTRFVPDRLDQPGQSVTLLFETLVNRADEDFHATSVPRVACRTIRR